MIKKASIAECRELAQLAVKMWKSHTIELSSYGAWVPIYTFSHYKSIVDKKTRMDLPMRYQPYKSKLYETLLHRFLK